MEPDLSGANLSNCVRDVIHLDHGGRMLETQARSNEAGSRCSGGGHDATWVAKSFLWLPKRAQHMNCGWSPLGAPLTMWRMTPAHPKTRTSKSVGFGTCPHLAHAASIGGFSPHASEMFQAHGHFKDDPLWTPKEHRHRTLGKMCAGRHTQ